MDPGTADEPGAAHHPPVLHSIEDVVDLVRRSHIDVHVRFGDPDDDLREPSVDHASGLRLPGLSVNPVTPPAWWQDRPLEDWVIRQICSYAHLQEHEPQRSCVLVTGTIVDRGPDNEPLLGDAQLVAILDSRVVREAIRRHRGSDRPEDAPASGGAAPWQA